MVANLQRRATRPDLIACLVLPVAAWLALAIPSPGQDFSAVAFADDVVPTPLATAPEKPAPPSDGLQLDDTAEPLHPAKARTGREEDRIRALALYAAARVAEQKQDYPAALKNYQRAARFDPRALAPLREIVPLAFNLDRQSEGVRYALLLAERDPADPALLRRLAVYLTEEGDAARALKLYEKAIALEEKAGTKSTANTALIQLEMGRLYFVQKEYEKAANNFAQVMQALDAPAEKGVPAALEKGLLAKPELTFQLFGESFLEAGRATEAQAAFDRVQKAKADEARQLYNQARVEATAKRPAQALARLETYFDKHFATQGTGPYETLAEVLASVGQEDQLLKRLEALRAADPENLPLAYFLAERYRKQGQFDLALPIYKSLVESRKDRPPIEAVQGLIEVYHAQQNEAELLAILGDVVGRTSSLTPLGDAGKKLLADETMSKALVAAAQKQLADDPAKLNYGARLAAALVAVEQKNFDAGKSLFEAAMSADGAKPADALLNWGLELFMANQSADAVAVLERGLKEKLLPEDNPAIYYYLAGAMEMSGRTDEAIEQARKAAELDKDSARYASRVAWIQYHAKRYEAARKSYQELLDKYDKQHDSPEVRDTLRDARLVLSNIAVLEHKPDEAEEWLEQLLDEFPEDVGALNDLGYLWADGNKHLELAEQMISVAVAADPKNMAYRDSLGWVLYRLGKYPEAVAELKVAAGVAEPDGVVLDHLAEAQLKAGQREAALQSWKRSIEAFEKDGETEEARKTRDKLAAQQANP